MIPGNHDRYTTGSVRYRQFEEWFGVFAPPGPYPWLRPIDDETAILGLDADALAPARRGASSRPSNWPRPGSWSPTRQRRPRRLIVACHYPVAAPPVYAERAGPQADEERRRGGRPGCAAIGPHLYCCGHVHAAWAFVPPTSPSQLCLNAGAPLLRDPTGLRPPGFLEIDLHERRT